MQSKMIGKKYAANAAHDIVSFDLSFAQAVLIQIVVIPGIVDFPRVRSVESERDSPGTSRGIWHGYGMALSNIIPPIAGEFSY